MALDVSAYDAALKEDYQKSIIDILNSRDKTRQLFQKDSSSWEGRHVRYPLQVNRNEGVMSTGENRTLPDAGNQVQVETQIPMRYLHGRIQLSIQVIKHSRNNKGAFKRAMDHEMRGLVRDLHNERNRQIFGYGDGVLGVVESDPGTGTTVEIKDAGGVAGLDAPARWLRTGMNVAFIDPGGPTIRAGGARTISSRNAAIDQITVSAAMDAAVAVDDVIVRAAKPTTTDINDTAHQKEAMGLLGLIDDGTYVNVLHDVNRTTYPIFKSQVISSVGALSADVIQRGIDIADQAGEGSVKHFICHHSVRRAYLTLMESDRRYTMERLMRPDAGTKAAKMQDITYGEVPWIVDKDAPYKTLFGCDPEYNTRFVEVEGEWADDDGTILLRLVDQDAYEARFRIFDNYANDRPGASFRLDGITANVVAVAIE